MILRENRYPGAALGVARGYTPPSATHLSSVSGSILDGPPLGLRRGGRPGGVAVVHHSTVVVHADTQLGTLTHEERGAAVEMVIPRGMRTGGRPGHKFSHCIHFPSLQIRCRLMCTRIAHAGGMCVRSMLVGDMRVRSTRFPPRSAREARTSSANAEGAHTTAQ
eukprot:gene11356-biopygen3154